MKIIKEGFFINPLKLKGPEQMAIDLFLLERSFSENSFCMAIRFYTWDGNWLSIGKNQKNISEKWIKLSKENKIKLVRRPTGGQSVLHSGGITYAIIWKDPPRKKKESYLKTAKWLINGFQKVGIDLFLGNEPATIESSNCFSTSTIADLVDKSGRKYVGSSQFWKKGHLLQHGEILIEPSKELWKDIFNNDPPKIKTFKEKDKIINYLKKAMVEEWPEINWKTYKLNRKEMNQIKNLVQKDYYEFNPL